MSLFVYRKADSNGARALSEALPLGRRWKDVTKPIQQKVRQGDRVIAWGDYAANLGVPALNNVPLTNKFDDALKLAEAGVKTIEVSRTKPADQVTVIPAGPDPAAALWAEAAELAEDFVNVEVGPTINRSRVTTDAVSGLSTTFQRLLAAIQQPAPTATEVRSTSEGWIPRLRNHIGGNDLLTPPTNPDFWVKKLDVVEEYRIHSFCGISIAAAIKDHRIDDEWARSGKTPNPWIRSWDGGWRVRYADFTPKQAVRDIAHAAIKALGLDFGAVDIGKLRDGSLVVFECNRAPGIEGQTVEKYVNAIDRWVKGELPKREEAN